MPCHQSPEGSSEDGDIEFALQIERGWNVVDRVARLMLIEQPEALLS